MPSQSRTLRTAFTRAFVPKLVLLAAVCVYVAPGFLMPSWDVASDSDVMAIRPHVEDSPAALVAEHGCWTGEAPADMQGVVPGHVVVTVDGSTRLGGERMVGKALEQLFEGAGHGLVVAGFCR